MNKKILIPLSPTHVQHHRTQAVIQYLCIQYRCQIDVCVAIKTKLVTHIRILNEFVYIILINLWNLFIKLYKTLMLKLFILIKQIIK